MEGDTVEVKICTLRRCFPTASFNFFSFGQGMAVAIRWVMGEATQWGMEVKKSAHQDVAFELLVLTLSLCSGYSLGGHGGGKNSSQ